MLTKVVDRWIWDHELAIVAWGPLKCLEKYAIYSEELRRSTKGRYYNPCKI